MKFQVQSKTLYAYLVALSKVLNSKNALAILNNFKFDVKDNVLTVQASNTEIFAEARLSVESSEGNGSFCLDAKKLTDLLKRLPSLPIIFNLDDKKMDNLRIDYGTGKYDLTPISATEFPVPDDVKNENGERIAEFVCPTQQILNGIDKTIFAVSTETIRPQLCGIFWDIKPDSIVFVATDTHQLVKYRNKQSKPGVECSFVLFTKAALALKTIMAKEASVQVRVNSKSVVFKSDSFTLRCSLPHGNYPNYDRVIPQNNPITFTMDRQALYDAIDRVSVCSDSAVNLCEFDFNPGKLTLKSKDINFGSSAQETMSCDINENMAIGFRGDLFSQILSSISTANIRMKLSDPARPGVIQPGEDDEFGETVIIIMPMQIID